MAEPVDPLQGGVLDGVETPPGSGARLPLRPREGSSHYALQRGHREVCCFLVDERQKPSVDESDPGAGLRFADTRNPRSWADTFMVMATSDRELWAAAVHDGDAEAFGVLFERHARAVYNHLFRRCTDWSTAEDLTSVVFLEAWRMRHRVELERESALPWLLGVATNVVLNHRRGLRRYRAALSRVPVAEVGAPASAGVEDFSGDVAERVAAESQMRLILALVDRLPERERQVLELCAWDQLSYEDAAAALGVPVGTVRSRLSRARSRLRELEGRSGHERGVDGSVQRVPEVEQ